VLSLSLSVKFRDDDLKPLTLSLSLFSLPGRKKQKAKKHFFSLSL